ncbi:hypothetical protein P43SY_006193 [Pythium insidiosum]|uniref:Uncharacterized protein n=1 Tax=Pythium insidiosum TaxID=114742 RepID=A0AAD5LGE1_PYTIN|nr:hypothetical protein P43SY_006193 [Pythium insidiosum]
MVRDRRRRDSASGSDGDESDEEWLPLSSQARDAERGVVVRTAWQSDDESDDADEESDAEEDADVPLAQRDVADDDSETEDERELERSDIVIVPSEEDPSEDDEDATDDEQPAAGAGDMLADAKAGENEGEEDDDEEEDEEDEEEDEEDDEEDVAAAELDEGADGAPARPLSRYRALLNARSLRRMLRHLQRAHLPRPELLALKAGRRPTGPPLDLARTVGDQWKRKFRWPMHLRNVKKRRFAANLSEIAADHELDCDDDAQTSSAEPSTALLAALPPLPTPVVESVATAVREPPRKRPRSIAEDAKPAVINAAQLRTVSRVGTRFTDRLLTSLMVKNGEALQGVDTSYAQQCWTPLPTAKTPIANWRFVLEHLCQTRSHPSDVPPDALCPRLRKSTLLRIRDRLKTLYGTEWRHDDQELFELVDHQAPDPPTFNDADTRLFRV